MLPDWELLTRDEAAGLLYHVAEAGRRAQVALEALREAVIRLSDEIKDVD